MIKEIEIVVPPKFIEDKEFLYKAAAEKLKVNIALINAVKTLRRSIDARSKNPIFRITVGVYVNESPVDDSVLFNYQDVSKAKKSAVVVGFGPAGMFAALRLIELGIKPVVFERGKNVRDRRKDLREIQQFSNVNPESNYCFGEGGAGTYSDGKLYTRSTKRGDVKRILQSFVNHSAHQDILIDAHPHIGSNRLPAVVQAIRETIIKYGGEINFNSKVTDLIISGDAITGVVVNNETELSADAVILSTGHSARDIFKLLHKRNIYIEPKPFAMGVRIEHPQALINEMQYHSKEIDSHLPAASYSLVCNIEDRGVYSFCMCPGGIIVPSATDKEEVVVNGMSLSKRDSPFANSGIVVSVNEKDWDKYKDDYPFGSLMLQQEVEKKAFSLTGNQSAPAQKMTDFVEGKLSAELNKSSYIPGIVSAPLHTELPGFIAENLRKAFLIFNKKMRGYYTSEAQILAAETRTSSPIRVKRDPEYMSINIKGLFPSGEGAGYAGGIVSAAIDGENSACAAAKYISFKG